MYILQALRLQRELKVFPIHLALLPAPPALQLCKEARLQDRQRYTFPALRVAKWDRWQLAFFLPVPSELLNHLASCITISPLFLRNVLA